MHQTNPASSSKISQFRKPHEILSSASPTGSFSHSRARNRSSGGGSVQSQQDHSNLLVDDFADGGDQAPLRAASRMSWPRSRSASPPWDGLSPHSIPLLPMQEGSSGQSGTERSLLSRTPSPHSKKSDDLDRLGNGGSSVGGLRIGGEYGSEARLRPLRGGGKFGWWLWNTQRGRIVYIGVLLVLFGGASIWLSMINSFMLQTGVYKFVYPITTTIFQLILTQLFLYLSASITRSFSRSLNSLGLEYIVAPRPTPSKGKRRASDQGIRDLARRITTAEFFEGSIFGFKWREAKKCLPLAMIYSLKIVSSNISKAYTHPSIYQVSRVPSLPLAILFTFLFLRNQPLSVTTLSSCITMTLSLVMACLRPGTRFAIEGFLAGIFSTIFVAAYPILLSKTYKSLLSGPSSGVLSEDLLGVEADIEVDDEDQMRTSWKLLHYVNVLSIFLVLPWVLLTGEGSDISRNCYILDVPWFWLMVLFGGIGAWATFMGGFLVVQATTPLTMVASTYPRAALQALLAPEKLPIWSWVGVLTCWGGAIWYLLGRAKKCGVSLFDAAGDEEDSIAARREMERINSTL